MNQNIFSGESESDLNKELIKTGFQVALKKIKKPEKHGNVANNVRLN